MLGVGKACAGARLGLPEAIEAGWVVGKLHRLEINLIHLQ